MHKTLNGGDLIVVEVKGGTVYCKEGYLADCCNTWHLIPRLLPKNTTSECTGSRIRSFLLEFGFRLYSSVIAPVSQVKWTTIFFKSLIKQQGGGQLSSTDR